MLVLKVSAAGFLFLWLGVFITAAPTGVPSSTPTDQPTTLLPTAQPSITGLVVTLDVSMTVDSELSDEQVTTLTDTILSAYNVEEDDISTEISYTTSGSLELDLPEDVTAEEVGDSVVSTLAEALGVHPRDVTVVSVDLETGEVVYTVSSSSYDDTAALQTSLDSLDLTVLESDLQELLPGATIVENSVEEDVTVDVTVVIDGSAADNIGSGNAAVTSALADQGYTVETSVTIVTAAPSVSPSFTTVVPSASPSITGIVVTLSLSKSGEVFDAAELASFTEEIAASYGVSVSDVDVSATYTVSGSVSLDSFPEDLSSETIEALLEESIAESLGLHARDVEVVVDPTTGEATYNVIVSDSSTAEEVLSSLQADAFVDDLNANLASENPLVSVGSVEASEDIVMDLVVTVDATESTVDVTDASAEVVGQFESQGYDADVESNVGFIVKFCF